MSRKHFLHLVLVVVYIFVIPGCYTVLYTAGDSISESSYVNNNDDTYIDEPILIVRPGCWDCYYYPNPWWYPSPITTTEAPSTPPRTGGVTRGAGDRGDTPIYRPSPSGGGSSPITTTKPSRPYTPPGSPSPTGGGTTPGPVKSPDKEKKSPDKVDKDDSPAPAPVVPERKRENSVPQRSEPVSTQPAPSQPSSNDSSRDRSNSNSNNDNNTSTRSNGGGRR